MKKKTDKIVVVKPFKSIFKKGDTCPNCGKTLEAGGISADAWCPRPVGCGALFGQREAPAKKWGKREDGFIAAVEKWLAASPDRSEIKALIADPIRLYEVCGYAPAAWKKAVEVMKEYLLSWESKVVAKTLKPYVEKLNEATTPPSKRTNRENIQSLFDRQAGNKSDRWKAVAEVVIKAAEEQSGRTEKKSDYQTATQLKNLINELKNSTAKKADIKRKLAWNLQRYMNEKPAKRKKA